MTMNELMEVTREEWLISLWPLWLLCFALALGLLSRKR